MENNIKMYLRIIYCEILDHYLTGMVLGFSDRPLCVYSEQPSCFIQAGNFSSAQ